MIKEEIAALYRIGQYDAELKQLLAKDKPKRRRRLGSIYTAIDPSYDCKIGSTSVIYGSKNRMPEHKWEVTYTCDHDACELFTLGGSLVMLDCSCIDPGLYVTRLV